MFLCQNPQAGCAAYWHWPVAVLQVFPTHTQPLTIPRKSSVRHTPVLQIQMTAQNE